MTDQREQLATELTMAIDALVQAKIDYVRATGSEFGAPDARAVETARATLQDKLRGLVGA